MLKESVAITQWAEEDRPREKMISKGRHVLTDAELLAILIGTGSGDKTAVDLGRSLLQLCEGDLYKLGKLPISQLMTIKGIGSTKAVKLLAALELGRRRSEERQSAKKQRVITSYDGYSLVKYLYSDLPHEEFHVILLQRNGDLIGINQVSKGGVSGTYTDPKIIFKIALEAGASAIVLCHNHPGGHLRPSNSDTELTRKIIQFGKMIEMDVLDHLIITENGYFSFADNGVLV